MPAAHASNPFPSDLLEFRYSWRPYQQRVLNAVDLHLQNRKLHVVAAPGAGKTTLGIEVCRRLGAPALILSPTRGIRDQWIDRLRDFLPPDASFPPEWAGTDPETPAPFTSITYQALHSGYRAAPAAEEENGEETDPGAVPESGEIQTWVRRLRQAGIRTLVLDEAHHLRQEWWKALSRLCGQLPDLILVALTATPPYDVSGAEWDKYTALCGPIDEEISVPELVKSGTLCAHQDFLWLVRPEEPHLRRLRQYDRYVREAAETLLSDPIFREAVLQHPWVCGKAPPVRDILEETETAFSLLIFLKAAGLPCPGPLCRCLDVKPRDLPAMDRRWWQVLVRSYLFDKSWPDSEAAEAHRKHLKAELRGRDLLQRRELRLAGSAPEKRNLALSPSKIDAISAIHRAEALRRGDSLRQVVLVDFIRDESLTATAVTAEALGAWPVFRALALQAEPENQPRLALLTGRWMIVHHSRMETLRARSAFPVPAGDELPALPGFACIRVTGKPETAAITRMLMEGEIRVLVGTRSLLGEGWDAPVINSLILCSYVGSFMLTNQMRGRAIRRDPEQPEKRASIWHLAAVDPKTPSGLSDLEDLRRKFGTFVGLDAEKPEITNGLGRMRLGYLDDEQIHPRGMDPDALNQKMLQRLDGALADLCTRWREAVSAGDGERVAPSVDAVPPLKLKRFVFSRTLKYAALQTVEGFIATYAFLQRNVRTDSLRDWLLIAALLAGLAFVVTLPKFFRLLLLWLRHAPVDGSLRQISLSLRDALCEGDLLNGPPKRFPLRFREIEGGRHSIHLQNADFYEQSLFADALAELLGPIENPRYLLTRAHPSAIRIFQRHPDYHAVPAVLGAQKETAACLHRHWEKRIGPSEMLYTRKPENRPLLLKARARAFSTAMTPKAARVDRWV